MLARARANVTAEAQLTASALSRLAELSREFLEPLIEGEGIDCGFLRGGRLLLYGDAARFSKARLDAEYQATHGLHLHALTAEQCLHREPSLEPSRERIAGGILTERDAVADCGAFCVALARLLEHRGVTFSLGRTVEGFDIANGQVRALLASQTGASGASNGATPIRGDSYVLAGRAHARARP